MRCRHCNTEALISKTLPYCPACIREKFDELRPAVMKIHFRTRADFGLPEVIPHDESGKRCRVCVNDCLIGEGKSGYCGVRRNEGNKIVGPQKDWAYLDWYHDPLPTNCVADWVCAGSHDHGYKNLAVFYEGCTFNCLFCQNWHYREKKTRTTVQDLARAADPLTGCICFFGGDPTPFAVHSIAVAKEIREKRRRKLRICWETNGSASPAFMEQWVDIALKSNGCIKIDFKTFSDELNIALCGSSNRNTKENIKLVAEYIGERAKLPILMLSTLLIPGYIDEHELVMMAKFISSVNKNIPWSFLGFYPHFYFRDLPCTSRKQADLALKIAQDYGIEKTHIGNVHLLV
ncbi:MAG: radical SAM protein [candidate division WOR-3 bacterium]|nr:MAG: radical SAM protein [candidate division WOR-3 bacterium]